MRVMECTLDDLNRPGYRLLHCLSISPLGAERYLAWELACAYYEQ